MTQTALLDWQCPFYLVKKREIWVDFYKKILMAYIGAHLHRKISSKLFLLSLFSLWKDAFSRTSNYEVKMNISFVTHKLQRREKFQFFLPERQNMEYPTFYRCCESGNWPAHCPVRTRHLLDLVQNKSHRRSCRLTMILAPWLTSWHTDLLTLYGV